jgi:hypothetical protein
VEGLGCPIVDTMCQIQTVRKLLLSYQLVISATLSTLKDPVVVNTTTSSCQMVRCILCIQLYKKNNNKWEEWTEKEKENVDTKFGGELA